MLTKEELLARAKEPTEDALRLHPFYQGKVQVMPKCPIRDLGDFAVWYTPGVAAPCQAIAAQPELVYEHTNKANCIAIVTDGTRVLGLGDIGPEAGLPVMEGKSLLFKYLGGVDAVPLCLGTKDPDEFIRTVKLLEPSFGGINLEDIAQPKCFKPEFTSMAESNNVEAQVRVLNERYAARPQAYRDLVLLVLSWLALEVLVHRDRRRR